ncbi:MAG: hypothetical protein JO258_10235 [Alphaproteobacteria bacterium]|nr:hypothetical protein [Alphaproteobacteria bacterium]
MTAAAQIMSPERQIDPDGAPVDVFALPSDETSLEALLRELFAKHWQDITFGPIIQGAAWEMKAAQAPDRIGMLDGYLTISFGAPHFHICIGEHKGTRASPVSPELAHHRRTSRAELYRRISRDGTPASWGLRLFNGAGEQQITVLLPNPFLDRDDSVRRTPDWSRLDLWDRLRARWLGLTEPDPLDRAGRAFRHD